MVSRDAPLISGVRVPDLELGLGLTAAIQGKSGGKTGEWKTVDTVDGGTVAVAAATEGDYERRIEGRQRGPCDP